MTGNGKHTTYKNGDDWGMVYYYCFTHIIEFHLNPYKLPYNAMGSFALKSGWSLMSFWYLPMDINFRMAAGYGTRLFYAFKNNQRTQQTLAFWCCFYPTATISTAGPGSHFRWAPRLAHFLPADRSLWGSLQRDGIWTQLASLQFTAIIPDEKHDIFFHSYFWTTPLTFTIFLQFFTMWVCLQMRYIYPQKNGFHLIGNNDDSPMDLEVFQFRPRPRLLEVVGKAYSVTFREVWRAQWLPWSEKWSKFKEKMSFP